MLDKIAEKIEHTISVHRPASYFIQNFLQYWRKCLNTPLKINVSQAHGRNIMCPVFKNTGETTSPSQYRYTKLH